MPAEITAERLTSLFWPRSVALVGASDKSAFSLLAYHNLVQFGFAERTYLVNRRGAQTHGGPTGARGSRPADWTRWPRWWPGWETSRWRSATTWSHWRSTRCALTAPPSRPWTPW